MKKQNLSAKLFAGAAFLSALVGVILFPHGLPLDFYVNPLFLVMLPRLIPFAVAIVLAGFALLYFGFERKLKRPASVPLAVAQLILLLLGALGHGVIVRFWWRVLGEEQATGLPMPLWSVMLSMSAFTLSLVIFVVNIYWSMRGTLRKA
jgi:hypothetical protein